MEKYKEAIRTKWMSENGVTIDILNNMVSLRSVLVPRFGGKIFYYHTNLKLEEWEKLSEKSKNGVARVARKQIYK